MKKVFFLIFTVLSTQLLFAQFEKQFEFNWGTETNVEGDLKNFIVDEATKNQYVLHQMGNKSYVSILDESNTYLTNKKFEPEKEGKFDKVHDVFLASGKLYLLASKNDEELFTVFIMAQEIGKENLEPIGEPKRLMIRKEEFIKDGPEYKDTRYNIKFCKDNSHFMIKHSYGPLETWGFRGKTEASNGKYDFSVFDSELNQLYTQNDLIYGEYKYVRDLFLDDDAWLYTLSFKKTGAEKVGIITTFDEAGEFVWRDTVKMGQYLKGDYHIEVLGDNVAVFSFYSSSKTKELYYGLYTALFNAEDGSRVYTTNNKFQKELTDKFKSRSSRVLPGAKIDEVARDITLGGYEILMVGSTFKGKVLIAEKRGTYYKEGKEAPAGSTMGDILVLKLKNDWSYEFGVRIPRHQYSIAERNYNRMSLGYINNETALHLFFNDDPDNYEKVKPEIRKVYNADQNGGSLVHYKIDMRNGNIDHKYPIHTNKDNKIVTYPGWYKPLGIDRMKIYGEIAKFKVGEVVIY